MFDFEGVQKLIFQTISANKELQKAVKFYIKVLSEIVFAVGAPIYVKHSTSWIVMKLRLDALPNISKGLKVSSKGSFIKNAHLRARLSRISYAFAFQYTMAKQDLQIKCKFTMWQFVETFYRAKVCSSVFPFFVGGSLWKSFLFTASRFSSLELHRYSGTLVHPSYLLHFIFKKRKRPTILNSTLASRKKGAALQRMASSFVIKIGQ